MKLLFNFTEEIEKDGKEHHYVLYNYPLSVREDVQVLVNHPQLTLLCDGCERKLNFAASVLYVGEERKDYCLTCFVRLDVQGKNYHYYIRPNLNVTITEQGWNILSELLLIKGLQRYGYGNWSQVKNYLDYNGHNFKSSEIESHFAKYYMENDLKPIFTHHFSQNNLLKPYQHEPTVFKPTPSETKLPEEKIKAYNPKRQEHLFDYDAQAELFICDLEFTSEDSPQEQALKLAKLEQYDYRIQQRQKREKFVVQHQLLSEEYGKRMLANGIVKNNIKKQLDCYSKFMSREESSNLSTLKATIFELTKQRKKSEVATFEKAYFALEDKKERRSLEIGFCPAELKVTTFLRKQQPISLKRNISVNYVNAVKKIKEIVDDDANITIISWPK